jgi:hypothetical protein
MDDVMGTYDKLRQPIRGMQEAKELRPIFEQY